MYLINKSPEFPEMSFWYNISKADGWECDNSEVDALQKIKIVNIAHDAWH